MTQLQAFHTSTHIENVGIAISSACGILSGFATAGLLLYLIWSAYGIGARRTSSNGFRSFLGTDAGKYLVSLIVVDFFHAVAYTSGLHWMRIGGTQNTGACTFQAFFLQAGDFGNTLWVFVISAHTLVHLFFSRRPPVWLSSVVLSLGWFTTLLLPVLGPTALQRDTPFYVPSANMWCWVSEDYPTPKLLYFFVWAMCALGGSVICYTLVFLRTAGYLNGGRLAPAHEARGRSRSIGRWTCVNAFGHDSTNGTDSGPSSGSGSGAANRSNKTRQRRMTTVGQSTRSVARKLLLYPVAYAILVLPLTITTLLAMSGVETPLWLLIVSVSIYSLGGLVDALLFVFTRRSFIQNATSTSRSRSKHQTGPGGNAPERHRLEGITVTRHELTIVDMTEFEAHSVTNEAKDAYAVEDIVTPVSPGKHDGPFNFVGDSDLDLPRAPDTITWTDAK